MIWAFIFVLWSLKLDDRLGGVYGTSKNRVGSGLVVGVVVDQRWQKACGMWENTIFDSVWQDFPNFDFPNLALFGVAIATSSL